MPLGNVTTHVTSRKRIANHKNNADGGGRLQPRWALSGMLIDVADVVSWTSSTVGAALEASGDTCAGSSSCCSDSSTAAAERSPVDWALVREQPSKEMTATSFEAAAAAVSSQLVAESVLRVSCTASTAESASASGGTWSSGSSATAAIAVVAQPLAAAVAPRPPWAAILTRLLEAATAAAVVARRAAAARRTTWSLRTRGRRTSR